VGDDMTEALDGVAVQLDPFSIEAFRRVRRITDDRVVRDVPVASASLQVDRIVIVEERAPADDDACRRVFRHQGERLVSERKTLQPHVAGCHVDAAKLRLAVSGPLPHDVAAGRTRFGEGDASTVAPGVHEEDVSRLRHRFSGGDASERIHRGSVAATRTRGDVKGPSKNRHHRNRPCRDGDSLYVATAIGIGERHSDVVRGVRAEEENASREHVEAVVVNPNERQRRPPRGGPSGSKLHGSRGVVIRIADDIPLDADRRNRGVGSNRARRHAGRLRREHRRADATGQYQQPGHGGVSQTGWSTTARGAANRRSHQSTQEFV
jgi:hypothetical protein